MSKCCELVNLGKGGIFFLFFFKKMYLFYFLAVVGLCCHVQALSSRGERGCSLLRRSEFSSLFSRLLLQGTGSRRGGFSSRGS